MKAAAGAPARGQYRLSTLFRVVTAAAFAGGIARLLPAYLVAVVIWMASLTVLMASIYVLLFMALSRWERRFVQDRTWTAMGTVGAGGICIAAVASLLVGWLMTALLLE